MVPIADPTCERGLGINTNQDVFVGRVAGIVGSSSRGLALT